MKSTWFAFGSATLLVVLILGTSLNAKVVDAQVTSTSTQPAKPAADNALVNLTTVAAAQQNRTAVTPLPEIGRTNDSSDTALLPHPPVESGNGTSGDSAAGIMGFIRDKNGAIMRAFYVMLGVTGIVVVYFIVRSVRLRRRRSKSRKYGVIAKKGDLEMTPLDQDEDDEDMTVFEAPNHMRR